MTYSIFEVPPGCYRNGTEYQSAGRWHDMAGVRFFARTIRPVGGWVRLAQGVVDSEGRGMVSWRANSGARLCAIGTVDKLWILDDDSLTNITPVDLEPGIPNATDGEGFGSGPFGAGGYGDSSGAGGRSEATSWSMTPWGDHLLALASHDGRVFRWQGDVGVKAAAEATVPPGNFIFMTEQQILVVLGANDDPRNVAWSDVQSLNFTPAPDNLAGDHKMASDGALVSGYAVRSGNLLLTTTDAHLMTYAGMPQVYSFNKLASGCGIVGSRAGCAFTSQGVVWMGDRQFFVFDGAGVKALPCDVTDYVFSDINRDQLAKVHAHTTSMFNEVTWHYPSEDSLECDRTVTWNYEENHWSINGPPARGAWEDAATLVTAVAVDHAGVIYSQEAGWSDDGNPRAGVFLQSGPVEIGAGDQVLYVTKILPDEVTPGAWQARFATRFSPESPAWDFGPYTLTPFTDTRFAGRQAAMKLELIRSEDARVGKFRLNVVSGGRR